MSCNTCGATMNCLMEGHFTAPGIFWCARCGTIRVTTDIHQSVHAPQLVERCRAWQSAAKGATPIFAAEGGRSTPFQAAADQMAAAWRDIKESIHPPENRPPCSPLSPVKE